MFFGLAAVGCFIIALLQALSVFTTTSFTYWDWLIGGLLALALHVTIPIGPVVSLGRSKKE
jgi:hypothetical protein